jgi:hypothetical protein
MKSLDYIADNGNDGSFAGAVGAVGTRVYEAMKDSVEYAKDVGEKVVAGAVVCGMIGAGVVAYAPPVKADDYQDMLNQKYATQSGWSLIGRVLGNGADDYNRKVAKQKRRRRAALEGGQGGDRVVYVPVPVVREVEKRLSISEWYDHNGDGRGQSSEYGEEVDGAVNNKEYGLVFDVSGEAGRVEYTINNISDGTSQNFSSDNSAMSASRNELEPGKLYQFLAKNTDGKLLDERKLYVMD